MSDRAWLVGLSVLVFPLLAGAIEEPSGSASAAVPEGPTITSVANTTQIYRKPGRLGAPLGYVRVGGSLAVRDLEPVHRPDCARGWYPVEPRGWVCLDADAVLRVPGRPLPAGADRFLRVLLTAQPEDGPLPFGYALSLGAPMYGRIPSESEQADRESRFGPPPERPGRWARGHDALAEPVPMTSAEPAPWFLGNGEAPPGNDARLVRKVARRGSMVSFVSAFEAEGRTWLLTPDLSLVPSDRTRTYRPTSFHGVQLGDEMELPLAWVRWRPAAKHHREADGRFVRTGDSWPLRTPIPLSAVRVLSDGAAYLETTEPGTFVAEASVVVARAARKRPPPVGPDDKWIQISISRGTLTAYEGNRPVFATLASPGRGGVPRGMLVPIQELVDNGTTPLGTYRIESKERFVLMSPDPEQQKYFLSDVPHVQYFLGPFALHAAYWHEDFGEPRSGGCVNLSPLDAQWLFGWTSPGVPDGWQGARATGPNGAGTAVQITP